MDNASPTTQTACTAWRQCLRESVACSPRLQAALLALEAEPDHPIHVTSAVVLLAIEQAHLIPALTDLPGLAGRLATATAVARGPNIAAGRLLLDEVVAEARLTANEPVLTWALTERGRALGLAGIASRSSQDLREAQVLAARLKMPVPECHAWTGLGMLYAQEGRAEEYEHFTTLGLTVCEKSGDVQGEAHCCCNLASALVSQDRDEEARSLFARALQIAETHSLTYVSCLAQSGIVDLHLKHRSFEQGLTLMASIRTQLRELGRVQQLVWNDIRAADRLIEADNPALLQVAAPFAQRAAEEAQNAHLTQMRVRALEQLSLIRERQGDLTRSLLAARQALQQQRADFDDELRESKRASEHAQAVLLATKQAAWERARRAELEATSAALQAALDNEARLRAELEVVARQDALTGLSNRRAHEESLRQLLADARRTKRPVGLILVDIDHFKRINDTHGHDVGDVVLRAVAHRLRKAVREADLVARWGGEEFTIAAPGADVDGLRRISEMVRQAIREKPVQTRVGPVYVTVSVGASVHRMHSTDTALTFRAADDALYRAKRNGRDQVHIETSEDGTAVAAI